MRPLPLVVAKSLAGRERSRLGCVIARQPGTRFLTRIVMPNPVVPSKTLPQRRRSFYRRFALALGLSAAPIGVSLGLGILGYHYVARFNWIDSLLNAAMILTGMGPVGALNSDAAKLFASAYALFSGMIFITATGILLTPIFHRVLHRFHVEEKDLR